MSLVCDEAGALIVVKMDQLREYLSDPVQYSKKLSVSKRIYTKAQKKFQENMKEMKFSSGKPLFFFSMKIKFHREPKKPSKGRSHCSTRTCGQFKSCKMCP